MYISLEPRGKYIYAILQKRTVHHEPPKGTCFPENTKFYLWADTTSYEDDGTGYLELKTYGINPLT